MGIGLPSHASTQDPCCQSGQTAKHNQLSAKLCVLFCVSKMPRSTFVWHFNSLYYKEWICYMYFPQIWVAECWFRLLGREVYKPVMITSFVGRYLVLEIIVINDVIVILSQFCATDIMIIQKYNNVSTHFQRAMTFYFLRMYLDSGIEIQLL